MPELNCVERILFFRIKGSMKSSRFRRLGRALIAVVALLEFSAVAQPLIVTNSIPRAIPRRASIIFIQCDGLGYGDLSCYGQTNYQTPNLDRLAAEGIRFTNYSAAPSAPVTQAAFLLGKNYFLAAADVPLPPEAVTVAQLLKSAGYHTGMVGDWDLSGPNSPAVPWRKGFDQFAGYLDEPDAANFFANHIWSLPPHYSFDAKLNKFVRWNPSQGQPSAGWEMLYQNTRGRNEYIPDLFTKAAINFIQYSQPDPFNHWRPFFLFLNYKIPDGNIEVPTDAPFSEEPWPQQEKNRAALILRIDDSIGQLRQQLDKSHMTNNVLIFFAGGSIPKKTAEADPDFFHSNIATNYFRVPMIAHWPEHIAAGQVSGLDWSADDFLPTAVEIGYAPTPTGVDGTSVLAALGGRRQ